MVGTQPISSKRYIVYVRDNFHYMDEAEEYEYGAYDSPEEAISVMKRIIDDYFTNEVKTSMGCSDEEAWKQYTIFGDDPYCPGIQFSGWDYARTRCKDLCSNDHE